MDTNEYPIQTGHLTKGSVIDANDLQAGTGVSCTDSGWRLAVLRIRSYIEKRLAARGLVVTIKAEGDTLRILTDPEASEYNYRREANARASMGRSLVRQLGVDPRNLTQAQQREHERRVYIQSRTLQATRSSRRAALSPSTHERTVPTITERSNDE